MKRLFVIGDIHGCHSELKNLLEKTDVHIKPEDEYVFLGDYIDRGPSSKQVVDLLIERSNTHPNKHIFIKGNHEDMMINDPRNFAYNGGYETMLSYEIMDPWSFIDEIPKSHKKFYKELINYYQVDNTVCVHAGMDPTILPEAQNPRILIWSRSYVTYQGSYLGAKRVIFGHTPNYTVIENLNSLGIDTACVFGGHLTCAVIEPITGDLLDLHQVKSNFSYR